MNQKDIALLLASIEEKGFIGAGPEHLKANPDWIALKAALLKPEKVVAPAPKKAGKKK